MNKISPELDRLMWTLAESDNTAAVDEFCERYPDHRAEMLKRCRLVVGIKGAKPGVAKAAPVPRFLPPIQPAPPKPALRWVAMAASGFAAVAIVFALTWKSAPIAKVDGTGKGIVAQQTPGNQSPFAPGVVDRPLPRDQDPVVRSNRLPGPDPAPNGSQSLNPVEPAAAKPKDVHLSNVSLKEAIELITDGSGYKVELAPGFPEPQVSIEFTAKTTMEILDSLGEQYGFSILDEGDSHLLLVPVPQNDSQAKQRVGG